MRRTGAQVIWDTPESSPGVTKPSERESLPCPSFQRESSIYKSSVLGAVKAPPSMLEWAPAEKKNYREHAFSCTENAAWQEEIC